MVWHAQPPTASPHGGVLVDHTDMGDDLATVLLTEEQIPEDQKRDLLEAFRTWTA